VLARRPSPVASFTNPARYRSTVGFANAESTVMSYTPAAIADNLFAALQVKLPHVAAHSRRVASYAVRLASQYGLSNEMVETIRTGALLHDVGKFLVPSRILSKPGRLRDREWLELRSHPDLGMELVERAGFSEEVCEIILHHHERPDGRGYPDQVKADALGWSVRIVSVMDGFDALTSPREYRTALSVDGARALIAREAGTRFCPWVVSGLLSVPEHLLVPSAVEGGEAYVPDGLPRAAAMEATEHWGIGQS
jgi:putative nucleotidyltransferase with HDIG domain